MKFNSKTLGMEVLIDAPDTPDELDAMVGEKDACLMAAVRYYVYHNWNPKFRSKFATRLEEESEIKREQMEVNGELVFEKPKDGEEQGAPKMESEQVYINRILADGFDEGEMQRIASEVADTIPFDPAKGGRERKALQKHYTAARVLIAAVEDGSKTIEEIISRFEDLNGIKFSSIGDGEWGEETLALAMRINEDRKLKNVGGDFL